MCFCFLMRQLHVLLNNKPLFPLCRANELPEERQTGPRFHMLQLLERYFTPTSAEAVKQALQQLAEQLAREQESKGQVGSPALSALQSGRAPLKKHAARGVVHVQLCFLLSGGIAAWGQPQSGGAGRALCTAASHTGHCLMLSGEARGVRMLLWVFTELGQMMLPVLHVKQG